MLVMLLLVLLQVPARTPVEKGAEHLQAKELARLSTGELALGYPLPNNQRGESASVSAGWNPIALELHRRLELVDSRRGEEWRCLLVGKGYVHLRPRWPAGVPLAMRVERPWILLDGGISMQPELSTRAGGLVP